MSKNKHNKKRNTAFLYESLLRELTKSIMKNKIRRKEKILKIMREHFNKNSILYKELEIYKTLLEDRKYEKPIAEKILNETKRLISVFNQKEIYDEQTKVIKKINKTLSKSVFMNFVPNYKNLATIKQMFDNKTAPATRVLLEEKILNQLISSTDLEKEMKPINNLAFKTFIKKFNSEYLKGDLLSEQKCLLSKYIASFDNNGSVELKIFVNEEVGRLKETIDNSLKFDEIKKDEDMYQKTKDVIKILENFREIPLDKNLLEQILKIQQLAAEIKNDD